VLARCQSSLGLRLEGVLDCLACTVGVSAWVTRLRVRRGARVYAGVFERSLTTGSPAGRLRDSSRSGSHERF